MLSLQFGVSIFGVVVTVAAFMSGLGLGSLIALSLRRRVRRPLLLFAALEGGVAVYALVLPFLFGWVDVGLTAIASDISLTGWYAVQALALLLLLLLPAMAMGAAFPMILMAGGAQGRLLGRLYGANACGGAVGALAPLWLLPAHGWTFAVNVVAVVGAVVSSTAAWLSRRLAKARPEDIRVSGTVTVAEQRAGLLAYGLIGVGAMLLEIGWTRLYGMVLLRTEYVLAVILAVYLSGIGAGSLLAHHLKSRRWLTVLPVMSAMAAVGTLWALPSISLWAENHEFSSLSAALWMEGAILALITLPTTLILGAWLPVLARQHGDEDFTGPAFYGVNSIGAALGALVGGFALLPAMGTPGTVVLGALALFVGGVSRSPSRRAWLLLPIVILFAWPVFRFPPVSELLGGKQRVSRDLYRYEDAMAITHVVELSDGQRWLLTDLQRMDAATDQAAVELQKDQARFPLLLQPAPRSILFLGLGTGISAAGSLPYDNLERTAVELSRGAIEAAGTWFAPLNGEITRHMDIQWDDARRFLRTTVHRFDVIVGDVFHPDLVGRSSLLSLQQFERAHRALSPGGVFVQWLALNQFDVDSLLAVARSFGRAFPGAVMFVDGFRLALVGFDSSGPELPSRIRAALASARSPAAVNGNEGLLTWMGRYWGRVPDGDGPVQDEWHPRIEFHLPAVRYGGQMNFGEVLEWLLDHRPMAAEAARELGLSTAGDQQALERTYIATDLAMRSWLASLRDDAARAQRLIRFAYQANPNDRWIGFSLADDMLATREQAAEHGMDLRQALERVLEIRPDHAETLRALWRLEREAGNAEVAESYLRRLAAVSPLDREVVQFKSLIPAGAPAAIPAGTPAAGVN
jgi:spermidine synthase